MKRISRNFLSFVQAVSLRLRLSVQLSQLGPEGSRFTKPGLGVDLGYSVLGNPVPKVQEKII